MNPAVARPPVIGVPVIGVAVIGVTVIGVTVIGVPVIGVAVIGVPVIGVAVIGVTVIGVPVVKVAMTEVAMSDLAHVERLAISTLLLAISTELLAISANCPSFSPATAAIASNSDAEARYVDPPPPMRPTRSPTGRSPRQLHRPGRSLRQCGRRPPVGVTPGAAPPSPACDAGDRSALRAWRGRTASNGTRASPMPGCHFHDASRARSRRSRFRRA